MIILLFFIFLTCFPLQALPGETSGGYPLKYRFNYTFQGETSGVLLLFFRYRFFFNAEASVLLKATPVDRKTVRFDFIDIDKPGLLIRTWGFSGKMLITAAADYNLEKAREVLEQDFAIFKKKAPAYSRFIKHQLTFPFKILTRGEKMLTFKRGPGGIHRDYSLDLKVQAMKSPQKYGFYFKIYPMLLEMVKVYNHSFLPGNDETLSGLRPGRVWKSPPLDFTQNMNRIGRQATDMVEKYVTFKQEQPFRLSYRVISAAPDRLAIRGEALPQVKIWNGYDIVQATRTIELSIPQGIVLSDRLYMEIRNKKGKGGFAQCALTLLPPAARGGAF
jgi:hypothetical protein